ncbi:hypothetical protein CCMSSC00406_0008100 [Pleurotus cornucopiae]|uniref:Uncharacterized protein n=1 Tax=Pleurotus cornucopiae TaxID=5321 RepID=A0ACB7IJX6_PLECO|nr:hypothetical protein CCMSSC00406_0008100 [Pleurotus cornucopiae]
MIIAHFVLLCFGALVGGERIRPPVSFRVQEPIFRGSEEHYDSGLFTPAETLDALSDKGISVLGHPAFPNYGARIKRSGLCDDTVRAYTGYIDMQARHLFFYFFESRSDPDTDAVLLGTNGGPGASSAVGLLMELGPCHVLDADGPKYHPESWNSKANIFFIDQPVGTGFSYAEYGETAETTEDAAKDVAAFVVIFFENFSGFRGRGFHLSGESYAARPLSALRLGNIRLGRKARSARHNANQPVLNHDRLVLPPLHLYIGRPVLDIACVVPTSRAISLIISSYHHIIISSTSSVPRIRYITAPACALLGADPAVAHFALLSPGVNAAFFSSRDHLHPSALLERGVLVLVYAGTYDWVANWAGSARCAMDMAWSGRGAFNGRALREWAVDGRVAGRTRSAGGLTFAGLTFATVDAAGTAPYDKPKETGDAAALVVRRGAGEMYEPMAEMPRSRICVKFPTKLCSTTAIDPLSLWKFLTF